MTATTTHEAKREAPPMRPPAAAMACTVLLREPIRFSRDAVERALGALPTEAAARLDRLAEDGTKMRVVIDDRPFVAGVIARPMPRLAFARTLAHAGSAALAALIGAYGASLVVTCSEHSKGPKIAVWMYPIAAGTDMPGIFKDRNPVTKVRFSQHRHEGLSNYEITI